MCFIVVSCGEPETVENSTVTKTGTDYKDTATYVCNEGYHLEGGDLNRTCIEDGVWSGDPPVCNGK